MNAASSGHGRVATALDKLGIAYEVVRTTPAHSAEESAALQGIDLSQLLKTIVVRKGDGDYVFVLVPGDGAIDWKKLRKHLGVSRSSLPEGSEAERLTGYRLGAITPFGSATVLPIVVDESALAHPCVAVGGGERGVNIHLNPADLVQTAGAEVADIKSSPRNG